MSVSLSSILNKARLELEDPYSETESEVEYSDSRLVMWAQEGLNLLWELISEHEPSLIHNVNVISSSGGTATLIASPMSILQVTDESGKNLKAATMANVVPLSTAEILEAGQVAFEARDGASLGDSLYMEAFDLDEDGTISSDDWDIFASDPAYYATAWGVSLTREVVSSDFYFSNANVPLVLPLDEEIRNYLVYWVPFPPTLAYSRDESIDTSIDLPSTLCDYIKDYVVIRALLPTESSVDPEVRFLSNKEQDIILTLERLSPHQLVAKSSYGYV